MPVSIAAAFRSMYKVEPTPQCPGLGSGKSLVQYSGPVGIQAVRHQRDPEGLRKLAGNPPEKWDPVWSGTTFRYLGNAPSRQGLIFMFGYGLERGQRQVDSDAPFLHRYLGIGDWRIGLDAEIDAFKPL